MADRKQWISLGGLGLTLGVAVYMVIQLNAQTALGDFSRAAVAEVHEAGGPPVLRGSFAENPEEDDDVERKATLAPAGSDADAAGEAEVEVARAKGAVQEIEFSIRNVTPGATYRFLIDGREVGMATADRKGRVEIDVAARPGK